MGHGNGVKEGNSVVFVTGTPEYKLAKFWSPPSNLIFQMHT